MTQAKVKLKCLRLVDWYNSTVGSVELCDLRERLLRGCGWEDADCRNERMVAGGVVSQGGGFSKCVWRCLWTGASACTEERSDAPRERDTHECAV